MTGADLAPTWANLWGPLVLFLPVAFLTVLAMRHTSEDCYMNVSSGLERGKAMCLLFVSAPLWVPTWLLMTSLGWREQDAPAGSGFIRRGAFFVSEGVGSSGDRERLAIFAGFALEGRWTLRGRLLNYLLEHTPAERLPMLISVAAGDASLATAVAQSRELKARRQGEARQAERQQRETVAGAVRRCAGGPRLQRRGRAPRVACNARRGGSRRVTSRSAGGGGGDPPDGGDPEPGERPRLAVLAIAVLACALAGGSAVMPSASAGAAPAAVDQYWEEAGDRWSDIVDHFVDKGFGENAEILCAMDDRFGLAGMDELLAVLRCGDVRGAQRLCDLVTAQERSATKGDCYNRLIARRGAGGAVVIVIDQPGNPEYVPPLVVRPVPRFKAPRRCGVRARSSRGKASRRRGSRRTASRSPGGTDDPEPEPRPAIGRGPVEAGEVGT